MDGSRLDHLARSWRLGVLALARVGGDRAEAVGYLASLADLTMAVGAPEEAGAYDDERCRLLDELGEVASVGPFAPPRPKVIAAARSALPATA